MKTFEKFKVLNERELHARYEVNVETYNKTINVEAQLMVLMANRYILPAALEYQRAVAASVTAVKQAGGDQPRGQEAARRRSSSWSISSGSQTDALAALLEHSAPSAEKHAKFMRDKVVPTMAPAARSRRSARGDGAARHLAAADLPGDALHQVIGARG